MQIEVVSGSESFRGYGTARVLFSYYSDGDRVPMYLAAKDPKSGVRRIRDTFQNAGPNGDLCGKWFIGTYDVDEGKLFDLRAHRRLTGPTTDPLAGFGITAHMMLRARQSASLLQIGIPFTSSSEATIAMGYVTGRFDIIPSQQFEAYGLAVGRDIHYYADSQRDGFITVRVLEQGTPLPPAPIGRVVTKGDGRQFTLRKPGRRINL